MDPLDNIEVKAKEGQLQSTLKQLGSVIVAYSGGVDSSLLAFYARKILGPRAKIVIAISPSLAADELAAACAQARQFDWDLVELHTREVDRPEYQRNDLMRCYYCKSTLFEDLARLAEHEKVAYIAYGANLDDLKDFRPGHKAAREHHVISPLQQAALSKEEIRQLAHQAGLPSWDRPQAACLSSRFPTFQPISIEHLSQVDKAEKFLRSLGFHQVRVRHYDQLARIELDLLEIPGLTANVELMNRIKEELKGIGYRSIEVDPRGYRQGSANELGPAVNTSPGGKA